MIEILKYNGKEYPFKVGYYALKHTQRELKESGSKEELDIEKMLSGNLETYEPLLYYSLKMGHKIEGKVMQLKREEMEFMLDICLFDFINKLSVFFPKGGTPAAAAQQPPRTIRQSSKRRK